MKFFDYYLKLFYLIECLHVCDEIIRHESQIHVHLRDKCKHFYAVE